MEIQMVLEMPPVFLDRIPKLQFLKGSLAVISGPKQAVY